MSALPCIIAEWQRNNRETVRLTLDEYQGRKTIALRCWYDAGDGAMRPGKDGLTLGIAHLQRLAASFAEAVQEAKRQGLIHDDGSK